MSDLVKIRKSHYKGFQVNPRLSSTSMVKSKANGVEAGRLFQYFWNVRSLREVIAGLAHLRYPGA